ncbi:unnamed protein product, partial [Brachionus calyciflorus]
MKKLSLENSSQYSPSLNLRSRKINRRLNIEPLNNFTSELNLALPEITELSDFNDFDFDFFDSNDNTTQSEKKSIIDEFEIINENLNSETLKENSPFTWTLTKSQKEGYKVVSCGYAYTVDKPAQALVANAKKIYWKCELHKNCTGRAKSNGLEPPLIHTKKHNHLPEKNRHATLERIEEIKLKAINSNDPPRSILIEIQKGLNASAIGAMSKPDALRQMINRLRAKKFSFKKFGATSLAEISIPPELKKTFNGEEFYWDDSGADDKNRVIIFTTKKSIEILNNHSDWYADGTFDISPTFFKQIYSLHVIINGTTVPCLFVMLPNKKQSTYKKMFKMIKSYINKPPKSINMDFEKAAINAAVLVFKCKIHACFFHLSQSLFRRVQTKGLIRDFALNEEFRYSFKLVQALAFLPVKDVIEGFKLIQKQCPESFEPILIYFEQVYIGKLKPNSKSHRVVPRYPIELWSVFERVKQKLPRTNNNVESWHSRV